MGCQEWIFAVGFLAAAPARIAEDVDVWRPDGKAEVAIVVVVGDGVVVFGASLCRDDFTDGVNEGRIPCGCVADGLRKERSEAGARNAVEAFVPPVIGGNVEAGDCRGAINQLQSFFFEREPPDEIVDAFVDGECGIAEGHGCGGFDLLF